MSLTLLFGAVTPLCPSIVVGKGRCGDSNLPKRVKACQVPPGPRPGTLPCVWGHVCSAAIGRCFCGYIGGTVSTPAASLLLFRLEDPSLFPAEHGSPHITVLLFLLRSVSIASYIPVLSCWEHIQHFPVELTPYRCVMIFFVACDRF